MTVPVYFPFFKLHVRKIVSGEFLFRHILNPACYTALKCLVFKMMPAPLRAYQNLTRHYQKQSIKKTQTIGRQ